MEYTLGYTQSVFDMFHIGYPAILNKAASMCDSLIVGVNSDRLVQEYENKTLVIIEKDWAEIVKNVKSVDRCEIVDTLDKVSLHHMFGFDVVFIRDDWKATDRWMRTENERSQIEGDVIYLLHMSHILFTLLRVEVSYCVE